jgi:hypothetical protein
MDANDFKEKAMGFAIKVVRYQSKLKEIAPRLKDAYLKSHNLRNVCNRGHHGISYKVW